MRVVLYKPFYYSRKSSTAATFTLQILGPETVIKAGLKRPDEDMKLRY